MITACFTQSAGVAADRIYHVYQESFRKPEHSRAFREKSHSRTFSDATEIC